MNRWFVLIPLFALAASQFGCSSAPKAPPDTRAADEKAIRETEAEWVKDIQAKDLDKDVAHYADDASYLVPNMPIQTGKEAIRAAHREMLADPKLSLEFAPSKVDISKGGDLAYTQGSYTMTSTDARTKKPSTEKGKYLTIYRKQPDGSWRAVEDMLNSDAPAAAAAAKKPAAKSTKATKRKKR
jgi:uncharacterized protein (TIGR02246 family)